jgi:hypothetical protein
VIVLSNAGPELIDLVGLNGSGVWYVDSVVEGKSFDEFGTEPDDVSVEKIRPFVSSPSVANVTDEAGSEVVHGTLVLSNVELEVREIVVVNEGGEDAVATVFLSKEDSVERSTGLIIDDTMLEGNGEESSLTVVERVDELDNIEGLLFVESAVGLCVVIDVLPIMSLGEKSVLFVAAGK